MNNLIEKIKNIPKEELQILVDRELASRSFYEFFKMSVVNIYNGHDWDLTPPFYKAICDILQKEYERYERGEDKASNGDIVLSLPFRSGKSTLLECYCAWLWIKDETIDILHVCATQSLTVKSARMVRIILLSDWFKKRWDIPFAMDSNAKSNFSTMKGGTHLALSIGSSAIGRNATLLLIDDPNDPAEAHSEAAIRDVIDTYRDVLYSRLNNDRCWRVICQQRVSGSDLTGWVEKNTPEKFRFISLPVILNKSVTKGMEYLYDEDGYLFASRYGKTQLENYRKTLTPTAYASQLMQSPTALQGTIWLRDWFKIIKQTDYLKLKKENTQNLLFLDTAMTGDEKNNDPTAFYMCTLIDGKIYIIKAEEKWLEFYELVEEIKEWISAYNIKKCYIEKKSSGISVIQELKRQLRGQIIIIGIESGSKSKQERARMIQPYLNNGKVILVADNWNSHFIEHCVAIPYGAHDDMADCLTYSVLTLLQKRYTTPEKTNKIPETVTTDNRGMAYSHDDFDMGSLY